MASRAMQATAYTYGDCIGFARTPELRAAAHEAAHVVQQRAGVSLPDGVGRKGDAYERHADAVADLVVRGERAEPLLERMPAAGSVALTRYSAVQRNGNGDGAETEDVSLDDMPGGAVYIRLLAEWQAAANDAITDWTSDKRASEAQWSNFTSSVLGAVLTIVGVGLTGPAAAGLAIGGAVINVIRAVPDSEDPVAAFREAMRDAYEEAYDNRIQEGRRVIREAVAATGDVTSGERDRRIAWRCFHNVIEGVSEGEIPNINETRLRARIARHLDYRWRRSQGHGLSLVFRPPPRRSTQMDVVLSYGRVTDYLSRVDRALTERALDSVGLERVRRSLMAIARGNDVTRLPDDMRRDVLRRIVELIERSRSLQRQSRTSGGMVPVR